MKIVYFEKSWLDLQFGILASLPNGLFERPPEFLQHVGERVGVKSEIPAWNCHKHQSENKLWPAWNISSQSWQFIQSSNSYVAHQEEKRPSAADRKL